MSRNDWQSFGTGRWDMPGVQWLVTWRDRKADPGIPAGDVTSRCVGSQRIVGQMVLAIEKAKNLELVMVRKRSVPAWRTVWLQPQPTEDVEQLSIWDVLEPIR